MAFYFFVSFLLLSFSTLSIRENQQSFLTARLPSSTTNSAFLPLPPYDAAEVPFTIDF